MYTCSDKSEAHLRGLRENSGCSEGILWNFVTSSIVMAVVTACSVTSKGVDERGWKIYQTISEKE